MKTLRRYLSWEILRSTTLIFAVLLMLFAFFDLIRELNDIGGGYRIGPILVYVLLSVPGHVYELFPIAALIGALFAIARLNAHSEFTMVRVFGVSVQRMALALMGIGALFTALTFVFGEFLGPLAEQTAQKLRVRAMSTVVAQQFRSGLWVKDTTSFVNVAQVLPDATLVGVRIYEFDRDQHLTAISFAEKGRFGKDRLWRLFDVTQTRFGDMQAAVSRFPEAIWYSLLTPDIVNVLLVKPEQMAINDLYSYIQHLREGRQQTARYDIALWSKFVYPLAVPVMIGLAIPFASYQRRAGGVGGKVFAGIMVGLGFHLTNRLFAQLGALNSWPAPFSAAFPTLAFLGVTLALMWWVERR